MTANAMKVDLDACLAAGMNDHVTKPIDRRTLVATLRRWLPAQPPCCRDRRSAARARQRHPRRSPVPRRQKGCARARGRRCSGTLRRLGIDRQPRTDAAAVCRRPAGDTGGTARRRRHGRWCDGRGHAHAIAGASGNLGADGLRAAAKALEQAGREGRTDLTDLLAVVEERAAVVLTSIEGLRPPAESRVRHRGPALRSRGRGRLDRLTIALDNYDVSSASAALADLDTSGLPAGASDDLEHLRRSVDGYDYGEARGLPRPSPVCSAARPDIDHEEIR